MLNIVGSNKGQGVGDDPVYGCPMTLEIFGIIKHARETLSICIGRNKTVQDEDLLRERCKVALQDLASIPDLVNQIRGMPNKYNGSFHRREREDNPLNPPLLRGTATGAGVRGQGKSSRSRQEKETLLGR